MWLLVFIGIAGLCIWYFNNRGRKAAHASSIIDAGNAWLKSQGIIPETVHFNMFKDIGMSLTPEATVIVGIGKDLDGTAHGFVFEHAPDGSVTRGVMLASPAIATQDKRVAMEAKYSGTPMMDILQSHSLAWVAEGKPAVY